MAREAGAKRVYFASCAPPIRNPNVYGIDMPVARELVAYNRTEQQVAEYIGADALIYQRLDDLIAACRQLNPALPRFDVSVFDGEYVTGDVSVAYLHRLESLRCNAKHGDASVTSSQLTSPTTATQTDTIGLFNTNFRR